MCLVSAEVEMMQFRGRFFIKFYYSVLHCDCFYCSLIDFTYTHVKKNLGAIIVKDDSF